MTLAIIGGTGIEQLEGLETVSSHRVDTPYGEPSRAVDEGRLGGARLFFLQRHGSPDAIPPHSINYRANIWALRELGATDIVAINAVGGITPAMATGSLVIPHQLIDYSWGREHTFDEGAGGQLLHIDFTEPYDPELRRALLDAAAAASVDLIAGAVYGVAQGPRLETAAEVDRMERDGCDVVGMTAMPETALARELGLAYASVSMVVNPAAGRSSEPITLEGMRAILSAGAAQVRALIRELVALRYSG